MGYGYVELMGRLIVANNSRLKGSDISLAIIHSGSGFAKLEAPMVGKYIYEESPPGLKFLNRIYKENGRF